MKEEFTFTYTVCWTPTCLLRWQLRRIDFDPKNTTKVLQQMWQGSNGEQEWRDIEIV